MRITFVIIFTLLASFTFAQLPDAPSTQISTKHKFWNKEMIAANSVSLAAKIADATYTCQGYHHSGFRERWLPINSCATVSTWLIASQGTTLGIQYLVHKRGWHRLERWTPWISTSLNIAGMIKTAKYIRR